MKVFLVTGGADGIGKACAVNLVERFEKACVALIDINQEKLFETAELLKELGAAEVHTFVLDVSNFKKVDEVIGTFLNVKGGLDALIQSAGYIEPFSIEHTPLEEWQRTFDVNLHGLFNLTKLSIPYLENSKGKIINIASTSASSPRPGWTAYAASKAGVLNFSLSASEELAPKGIKVYCVSPGRCATELRKRQAPDEDPNSIMQPKTVGGFVGGLVSPKGDPLDGQDLVIRRQINL